MESIVPSVAYDEGLEHVLAEQQTASEIVLPTLAPEVAEEFEYQLLTGHRRTDGSFKTSEQLRTEYVRLTDNLIHKMTDGIMVKDPETGQQAKEIPDAVVFLDKSARPVAWLTNKLWDTLARDENGDAPKKPQFFFANIDREQWVNSIDPEGTGTIDVKHLAPSVTRGLRSIYVEEKHRKNGITEEIDTAPATLDCKTILIVDEVQATGRTLNFATNFYAQAFPTAKVAGTHWMSGVVMKGSAVGNADLPVWYSDTTKLGRGIDDRNPNKSQLSPSETQRLGGWFLSSPHLIDYPQKDTETGSLVVSDERPLSERDPKAWQLRREMGQLALDVKNGAMLVEPSYERDMDAADAMTLRLNPGFASVDEFYAALRTQKDQTK